MPRIFFPTIVPDFLVMLTSFPVTPTRLAVDDSGSRFVIRWSGDRRAQRVSTTAEVWDILRTCFQCGSVGVHVSIDRRDSSTEQSPHISSAPGPLA
jgi:hypothetical protein